MKRIEAFLVTGSICRDYHNALTGDLLAYVGMDQKIMVFKSAGNTGGALSLSACDARLSHHRRINKYPVVDAFLLENEADVKTWREREAARWKTLDQVTAADFPTVPA